MRKKALPKTLVKMYGRTYLVERRVDGTFRKRKWIKQDEIE